MNTIHKRRGGRSLAAILAAMLMASVLAVVAGSPAHAANTSNEALVDTNDDGVGDAREFGGRDRCDTALRLVNNFGEAKGLGSVSTAFVASGFTLVDAVSVSGLAGFLDAPVLLTPTDSLHGGDVSLAEAMMVGPIAHRLQLPVLMTAADELPSATTDFIESEDIEHVVIVGGTDGVSEDVANAVSDAGVDTVARIAGDTPAATSVALAGLLTGDCSDDLAPVSGNTVALVNRDALPDGIAAAPVLSSTYAANRGLVPILVVGDTLPASVRDYLAATPAADDDGDKLNLQIVAIGGTAAVSSSVMDAAIAAAASADALTVAIGNGGKAAANGDPAVPAADINKDKIIDGDDAPQVGDTRIILYFGDNVIQNATGADAATPLTDVLRDILEINGALAPISTVAHGDGGGSCDADTVTVTLSRALKAGDTISVVGGAKLGANEDQRAVGAASVTVAAPAPDRSRPTVNVILIAGEDDATISTSERSPDGSEAGVLVADATVELRRAAGGDPVEITPSSGLTLQFDPALAPGDRITISAGSVVDGAGNKSLQRSFTAIKEQASPRITSVLMSNLNHSTQAAIPVPSSLTGGGGTPPDDGDTTTTGDSSTDNPDIWILAKADGAAAGAAGNLWSVTFDRASTYDPDKDLDIDVRVNSRDMSVTVRFNNGKAKFGDLKAALEANSACAAMFEVKVDATVTSLEGGAGGKASTENLAIMGANTDTTATGLERGVAASMVQLANSVTKVAIQVTFNGYIEETTDGELLEDVLDYALTRVQKTTPATTLDDVLDNLGLGTKAQVTEASVVAAHPGTKVAYSATTIMAGMLPQVRDLVDTDMGFDGSVTDADSETGAAAQVAGGYAGDNPTTTKVQEDKNAASQVRIGRSSSVDAPE